MSESEKSQTDDTSSDTSSDSSSESEDGSQESDSQEEKITPCDTSFLRREGFPFSFWYMVSFERDEADAKILESLKNLIESINTGIDNLFLLDDITIQIIRGDRESDRLRILVPKLIVNTMGALDLRNLILDDLGFNESVEVIPKTLYTYNVFPMVLLPRQYDMGLGEWQSFQKYRDLLHPEKKTEEIEREMAILSQYDPAHPPKLTEYTDRYKIFIEHREQAESEMLESFEEEEKNVPSEFASLCKRDPTAILFTENITDEIKKTLGKAVVKCQNWFHRLHPDSKLRGIKNFRNNPDVYHFDFTKSSKKCKLCKVIHHSNRQYVTYSKKNKTAYYHCYDTDARGKQLKFKII